MKYKVVHRPPEEPHGFWECKKELGDRSLNSKEPPIGLVVECEECHRQWVSIGTWRWKRKWKRVWDER